MAQLADAAIGLLDTLGLMRVHFIDASLGGMIGHQLAARHGRRTGLCAIDHLIIYNRL